MNSAKWADLLRAYSARRFGLVALNGKAPFMRGWQRIKPQTVIEYLAANPGANVGIMTGVAGGVVVYDYDRPDSAEKFNADITSAGGPTATVRTGGGRGGQHFYFSLPPEVSAAPSGKLDGGDFKGDGGQVVAPPSVHPDTGREYEIIEPLEKMRVWTPEVQKIAGQGKGLKQARLNIRGFAVRRGIECIDAIANQVLVEGVRNETLFALYCIIRQNGDSAAFAEREVRRVNSQAKPPLPEAEVRAMCAARVKQYRFSCAAIRERFRIDLNTTCELCQFHRKRGVDMIGARDTVKLIGPAVGGVGVKLYLGVKTGDLDLNNKAEAARHLGVERSTLYRAIEELKSAGVRLEPGV